MYFTKGRNTPIIRIISVILICTFLWQEIVFAQGGPQESQSVSTKILPSKTDLLINLREFSIPRNLGTTKEVQSFNSKEVIINIKDAHDNLSAQESIVGLLDNLVTNYDIRTIAVEGSAGYVDTSIISSFPDREIKKELSDKLMAEGLISAAEYYSIITESGAALYGIDDKKMHAGDMDAFRTCLEERGNNYKKARALYQCLAVLEEYIYSDELKTIETNSILKNNGNIAFTNRWDNIRAIGEKNGIKPTNFTNINNLLKAIELEKKCNFNSTNTERTALMNDLKGVLDKNKLEELILKSISFKLGKVSASMYYSHLVDLARLEKIDLEKKYPNILTYVEYMALYESVDINALKDEVIDYEIRIKEKIFRNDDERKLAGLLRKASILSDLIEVKLTSTSLKYFDKYRQEFNAQEFTDFIKRMYAKYEMQIPADLDIDAIFEAMPVAEKFYELTLRRNDAMVANTIKRMRDKGESVAALVTGGFHTEGIAELLKKDKLSYLIILPKFDKNKTRPYITIITNKKGAYSNLTESGGYHIALETFFNNPEFVKEQAQTLAAKLREKFGRDKTWDTIKALRNYIDLYAKAQEAKVKAGELNQGQAEKNIAMMLKVIQAMESELKEEVAPRKVAPAEMAKEAAVKAEARRRAAEEVAKAKAERQKAAELEAQKKAEAEKELAAKAKAAKAAEAARAAAAKAEAEKAAAEKEAGAGRRIGTYEDAGKKAEALDARQGEFLAQAETSGVTETIEGEEVIVIKSDLGDVAVAYQFPAKDGRLKGKLIIVANNNTLFISEINKALKDKGFTYDDVLKEMKTHEVFEAGRLREGYSRLEAHRLASIDHALKFAEASLGGLTPYHYAELMQIESEVQLEKLQNENRDEHQLLYGRVGADYKNVAMAYEKTMKDAIGNRLAQMRQAKAAPAKIEMPRRFAKKFEKALHAFEEVLKAAKELLDAEDAYRKNPTQQYFSFVRNAEREYMEAEKKYGKLDDLRAKFKKLYDEARKKWYKYVLDPATEADIRAYGEIQDHAVNQIYQRIKRYKSMGSIWERLKKRYYVQKEKAKFDRLGEKGQIEKREYLRRKVQTPFDEAMAYAEKMALSEDPMQETVDFVDAKIKDLDSEIAERETNLEIARQKIKDGKATKYDELCKGRMEEKLAARKKDRDKWVAIKGDRVRLAVQARINQNEAKLKEMVRKGEVLTEEFIVLALCNVSLSMWLNDGKTLREHQMQAAEEIMQGLVTNVATGQGKTFIDLALLYMKSLEFEGAPVDLWAKDDLEAQRLESEIGICFEILGLSCGFISGEQGMDNDGWYLRCETDADGNLTENGRRQKQEELLKRKRADSVKNIRFVSHHIGFDLMHDWEIPNTRSAEHYLVKGFNFALIDEADSLLLDQAMSELIIAVREGYLPLNKAMPYFVARRIAEWLSQNTERISIESTYEKMRAAAGRRAKEEEVKTGIWVSRNEATGAIGLNAEGKEKFDEIVSDAMATLEKFGFDSSGINVKLVNDSLNVSVRVGEFYIGQEPGKTEYEVRLIDMATGTDSGGKKWQDGLDEAVNAFMGMFRIPKSGGTQSKISMKDLVRVIYNGNVSGLSGTMEEGADEVREVYGPGTVNILELERGSLRRLGYEFGKKGDRFKLMMRHLCESRLDKDAAGRPITFVISNYNKFKRFVNKTKLLIYKANNNYAEYNKLKSEIEKAGFADDVKEVEDTYAALGNKNIEALKGVDADRFLRSLSVDNEARKREIEEDAGRLYRITIGTNIMGRATDIKIMSIKDIYDDIIKDKEREARGAALEWDAGESYELVKIVSGLLSGDIMVDDSVKKALTAAGIELKDLERIKEIVTDLADVTNKDGLRDNAGRNVKREKLEKELKGLLITIRSLSPAFDRLCQAILIRYDSSMGLLLIGERNEQVRTEVQFIGRAGRQGMPGEAVLIIEVGNDTDEHRIVERAYGKRDRSWLSRLWYDFRYKKMMKSLEGLKAEREELVRNQKYEEAEKLDVEIKKEWARITDFVRDHGTVADFDEIQDRLQDSSLTGSARERAELEWDVHFTAAQKKIEKDRATARKTTSRFSIIFRENEAKRKQRELLENADAMRNFSSAMFEEEAKEIVDMAFPGKMKGYLQNTPESRKKWEKALKSLNETLHAVFGRMLKKDVDLNGMIALLEEIGIRRNRFNLTKKDIEKIIINFFATYGTHDERVITRCIAGVWEDFMKAEPGMRSMLPGLWRFRMWRTYRKDYRNTKAFSKAAAKYYIRKRIEKFKEESGKRKTDEMIKQNASLGNGLDSEEKIVEACVGEIGRKLDATPRPEPMTEQGVSEEAVPEIGTRRRVREVGRYEMLRTERISGAPETPRATILEKVEEDITAADPDKAYELGADGRWIDSEVVQEDVIKKRQEANSSVEAARRAAKEKAGERKTGVERDTKDYQVDTGRTDASGNRITANVRVSSNVNGTGASSAAEAWAVPGPSGRPGEPPEYTVIFVGPAAGYFNSLSEDEKKERIKEILKSGLDEGAPQGFKKCFVIENITSVDSNEKDSDGKPIKKFYVKAGRIFVSKTTAEKMRDIWVEWQKVSPEGTESLARQLNNMFGSELGFVDALGRRFFHVLQKDEKLDNGTVTPWAICEITADITPEYRYFMEDLAILASDGPEAFRRHERDKALGIKPGSDIDVEKFLRTPRWQPIKRNREREELRKKIAAQRDKPYRKIVLANPFLRRIIYSKEKVPIRFGINGNAFIGNVEVNNDNFETFKKDEGFTYAKEYAFEFKKPSFWESLASKIPAAKYPVIYGIGFVFASIIKSIIVGIPKYLFWTLPWTKGLQRLFLEKPKTDEELIKKYYRPTEDYLARTGFRLTDKQIKELDRLKDAKDDVNYFITLAGIIRDNANIEGTSENRKARLLEESDRLATLANVLDKKNKKALALLTRIYQDLKNTDMSIEFAKKVLGIRRFNIPFVRVPAEDQDILLILYSACLDKGKTWQGSRIFGRMTNETRLKALDIAAVKEKVEIRGIKAQLKDVYDKSLLTKRLVNLFKKHAMTAGMVIQMPLSIKGLLAWFGVKIFPWLTWKIYLVAATAIVILDFVILPAIRAISRAGKMQRALEERQAVIKGCPKNTKSIVNLVRFLMDPKRGNDKNMGLKVLDQFEGYLTKGPLGIFRILRIFTKAKGEALLELIDYYLNRFDDKKEGLEKAGRLLEFLNSRRARSIINRDESLRNVKELLEVEVALNKSGRNKAWIKARSAEDIIKAFFDDNGNLKSAIDNGTLIALANTLKLMVKGLEGKEKQNINNKIGVVLEEVRRRRENLLPEEKSLTDENGNIIEKKEEMSGRNVPEKERENFFMLSDALKNLLTADTAETESGQKDAEAKERAVEKEGEAAVEKLAEEKKPPEEEVPLENLRALAKYLDGRLEASPADETLRRETAKAFLRLAKAYGEEKSKKIGFFRRLWRAITLRAYARLELKSFERAVKIAKEGEPIQRLASMKLAQLLLERGKLERSVIGRLIFGDTLIKNIGGARAIIEGLKDKKDKELSDEDKEALPLALANLKKMVSILFERRAARDIYHKRASDIKSLIIEIMKTVSGLETRHPDSKAIKEAIEAKFAEDVAATQGRWWNLAVIRHKIKAKEKSKGKVERKLNKGKNELAQREERGIKEAELASLKQEIQNLEARALELSQEIASLKFNMIVSVASSGGLKGFGDNVQSAWDFVNDRLVVDIDACAAEYERLGMLYVTWQRFEDDLLRPALKWTPGKMQDMIIARFKTAWAKANRRRMSDEELNKRKEDDPEKIKEKKRITVGMTVNDIESIFIKPLSEDLPEGFKEWLAGESISFLGHFDEKTLEELWDKVKDMKGLSVLRIKASVLKRLKIDPAVEKMEKDNKKEIEYNADVRAYINILISIIQQSDIAEVSRVHESMLVSILPNAPPADRDNVIKQVLSFIDDKNHGKYHELITTLATLTRDVSLNRDILQKIFNLYTITEDPALFTEAKQAAGKFISRDFKGDTKALEGFVEFLLNTYAKDDYKRAIEVFDLLKEAVISLRRDSKFENIKAVADTLNKSIDNRISAVIAEVDVPLPEKDRFLSTIHNLYFAVIGTAKDIDGKKKEFEKDTDKLREFQNKINAARINDVISVCRTKLGKKESVDDATGLPIFTKNSIKEKLFGVRKERAREARRAYQNMLKDNGEASRLEADKKEADKDNDAAIKALEKALADLKKAVETGRKAGDIKGRGDELDIFIKEINDSIIRSYRSFISILKKEGKADEAAKKEYDMRIWAFANVNTLQDIPGDELTAAEEALDRMHRASPDSAKSSDERAGIRIASYKARRNEATEARKNHDEKDKAIKKLTEEKDKIENTLKGLKGKLDVQAKIVKAAKERYDQEAAGGKERIPGRLLKALKHSYEKERLRKLQAQIDEEEKKLKENEKKTEAAQRELEELKSALRPLEKEERQERENAAIPIASREDSFARAAGDYILAINQANESEDNLANEVIDSLAALSDSQAPNAPDQSKNILDKIAESSTTLNDRIKDRKKREIIRKRFEKTKIKICEKLLSKDGRDGRKELIKIFMSISGLIPDGVTIQVNGIGVTVTSLALFDYVIEKEDNASLGLMLHIATGNRSNVVGVIAAKKLMERIYRDTGLATEEKFPEPDKALAKLAEEAAKSAIAEEDKEKEAKEEESNLAREARVEKKKNEILAQLNATGIKTTLSEASSRHKGDEPWEKMDDVKKEEFIAGCATSGPDLDRLIAELAKHRNITEIIKTEADILSSSNEPQDLDKASELYEAAIKAGLDDTAVNFNMARIYEAQGLYSKAIEAYKKAFEKKDEKGVPLRKEAYEKLITFYRIFNQRLDERSLHEARAGALYEDYEKKKKEGKQEDVLQPILKEALDAINSSLAINEDFATALALKARILIALKSYNEALAISDRLLFWLNVTKLTYLYHILVNRWRKRDVVGAEKAEKDARFVSAVANKESGKKRKARNEALRAVKLQDNSAETNMILAGTISHPVPGIRSIKGIVATAISIGATLLILFIITHYLPNIGWLNWLYAKYWGGMKWITISTVGFSIAGEIFGRIKSRLTNADLKKEREYLLKAIGSDPKNREANDRLFAVDAELKDYDGLVEHCKKEEDSIGADRSGIVKAQRDELKKKRALAILDKFFMRTRFLGGKAKDVEEARKAVKEARQIVKDIEAKDKKDVEARITSLQDRMLKGGERRLFICNALSRMTFIFRIFRKRSLYLVHRRELLSASLLQDTGDYELPKGIFEKLIKDNKVDEGIKKSARKELSENYRLRAQKADEKDKARLLRWALYYDSENAKARLELGNLLWGSEGSVELVKKALEQEPGIEGAKEGHEKLANYYFDTGDYDNWLAEKAKAREKWDISPPVEAKDNVDKKAHELVKDIEEWAVVKNEIDRLERIIKERRTGDIQQVYRDRIGELEGTLANPLKDEGQNKDLMARLIRLAIEFSDKDETEKAIAVLKVVIDVVKDEAPKALAQLELVAAYEKMKRQKEAGPEAEKINKDRMRDDEAIKLLLIQARLLANDKEPAKILEGFDKLQQTIDEKRIYNDEIADQWAELFIMLINNYRKIQAEEKKEDDAGLNRNLSDKISQTLAKVALVTSDSADLSSRPIRSTEQIKKISSVIFAASMPIPDAGVAQQLLFEGDKLISNDGRIALMKAVENRIRTAIINDEVVNKGFYEGWRDLFAKIKSWKREDRNFKDIGNKGLGIIAVRDGRYLAARWYFGRRLYRESGIQALINYKKAKTYEGKRHLSEWLARRQLIKRYERAIPGGIKEREISLKISELYLARGKYGKALEYLDRAYNASKTDTDKKDVRRAMIVARENKILAWQPGVLWWKRTGRALGLLSEIEELYKLHKEEGVALDSNMANNILAKLVEAENIIKNSYRGQWPARLLRFIRGKRGPQVPRDVRMRILNMTGRLKIYGKDIDSAKAAFYEIYNLDERNEYGLVGLRDIAINRGENDEAVRYHEQALELGLRLAQEASEEMAAIYDTKAMAGRDVIMRLPVSGKFITLSVSECRERAASLRPEDQARKVALAESLLERGEIVKAKAIIDGLRDKDEKKAFAELEKKAGADIAKRAQALAERIDGKIAAEKDTITGRAILEGGVERYVRVIEQLTEVKRLIANLNWADNEVQKVKAADTDSVKKAKEIILGFMPSGERAKLKKELDKLFGQAALDRLRKIIEERKGKLEKAEVIHNKKAEGIYIKDLIGPIVPRLLDIAAKTKASGDAYKAVMILEKAESLDGKNIDVKLMKASCHVLLAEKDRNEDEFKKADKIYSELSGPDKDMQTRIKTHIEMIGYQEARARYEIAGIEKSDKPRDKKQSRIKMQEKLRDKKIKEICADIFTDYKGLTGEKERAEFAEKTISALKRMFDMLYSRKNIGGITFLLSKITRMMLDAAGKPEINHSENTAFLNLLLSEAMKVLKNEDLNKNPIFRQFVGGSNFNKLINDSAINSKNGEALKILFDLVVEIKRDANQFIVNLNRNINEATNPLKTDSIQLIISRVNELLLKEKIDIALDYGNLYKLYNDTFQRIGKGPQPMESSLEEVFNIGRGLIDFRRGNYGEAIRYLKKCEASPGVRYYLVMALMSSERGAFSAFRARWIAMNMWFKSRDSTFTQDAIRITGLARSIFISSSILSLGIFAAAINLIWFEGLSIFNIAWPIMAVVPLFAKVSYGKQAPQVPIPQPEAQKQALEQPAAEKGTQIMIGITGEPSDDEIKMLSGRYPDVLFVKLEGLEGKDAVERLEKEPGNAMVRIMTDFKNSDEVIMRMGSIVNAAQIQSFMLAYPYISSLNEGNISALSRDALADIFDILQRLLPQAQSLNLDYILTNPIPSEPEGAVRVRIDKDALLDAISATTPERPKGYIDMRISPADAAAWAAAYARSVDRYSVAEKIASKRGAKRQIESLEYDLADYLKGKDRRSIQPVIKEIAARLSVLGTTRYWERANNPSLFMARIISEIDSDKKLKPSDMCVAAFEEKLLRRDEKARADVRALISQIPKGSHIRVIAFGQAATSNIKDLIPGIEYVRVETGKPVINQIRLVVPNIAYISIFITKRSDEKVLDIAQDLVDNEDKAPSYIVMNKELSLKNAARINIVSLLRSVATGRAGLAAVGKFDEANFSGIKEWLASIGGFFKMLTDVSKIISEIFYAIKSTAISV